MNTFSKNLIFIFAGVVFVKITNAQTQFAAPASNITNFPVRDVIPADFNRDGRLDIVATSAGVPNSLLLLGDGAGNFSNSVSFAGFGPGDAGDLNGDGFSDLALARPSTTIVDMILNNPGVGFHAPVAKDFNASPFFFTSFHLGDINRDGLDDLAVLGTNAPTTVSTIFVGIGDGAGHFPVATPSLSQLPQGGNLAFRDVSGDGVQDAIFSNVGANLLFWRGQSPERYKIHNNSRLLQIHRRPPRPISTATGASISRPARTRPRENLYY